MDGTMSLFGPAGRSLVYTASPQTMEDIAQRYLNHRRMEEDIRNITINRISTHEITLPFSSPYHDADVQSIPRLARRTLLRRTRDTEVTAVRHRSTGLRPGRLWIMCGDLSCAGCIFRDGKDGATYEANMRFQVVAGAYRPVQERWDLFVTTMVDALNNTNAGQHHQQQEQRPRVLRTDLESFLMSPPVRGAFWEFCQSCGVAPSETRPSAMAAALDTVLPRVVAAVRARPLAKATPGSVRRADEVDVLAPEAQGYMRTGMHVFFGHVGFARPKTWGVGDYAVQFCVVVEAWRRYGLERGFGWAFGRGGEDDDDDQEERRIADLLCAVLLNWWVMTRDGCFTEKSNHGVSLNQLWEDWLCRYPVGVEEDDVIVESGDMEVLSGVGRAAKI